MNELREKIEYYVLKYGNDRVEFHGQDIDREPVLNAILDAVIAALPSELETGDEYEHGYNRALAKVKTVLLEAKENK